MNQRIENCLYQAGLTAQGCWDELDDYTKAGIEKFANLIVQQCADICLEMAAKCAGLEGDGALAKDCAYWIKQDFGVKDE
jgi:hypothetical protein